MRDILTELNGWHERHRSIALATVVQTWGSAPRKAGAKMAITLDGEIAGSVSGGCVENAVVEAALDSLKKDRPRLLHFGVADETAWEVGLACGGSIDIFVNPLHSASFDAWRSVLRDEAEAVFLTVVRGPEELLGREWMVRADEDPPALPRNGWSDISLLDAARSALSDGFSRRQMLSEELEVFLEVISPPPLLVMVGGVHIAVALVPLARALGYRTIVVDPRQAWGSQSRFPQVDQLIGEWPEEAFRRIPMTRSTAVAVLTHDPKLDDGALRVALSSPAFYVGALGSRSTQRKRRDRLLGAGLTEAQLARLHAPIGLEIGAESPEEIALAIMGEIVAAYSQRTSETPGS